MSKRKNRARSPNLPAETLARARQQAGVEEAGESSADAPAQAAAPAAETQAEAPVSRPVESAERGEERRSKRRASRRAGEGTPGARVRAKDQPLDSAAVADLLAHPTKLVSEEELRQQYSYVLRDLRSMGLLAAVLIVVLVILAQVL